MGKTYCVGIIDKSEENIDYLSFEMHHHPSFIVSGIGRDRFTGKKMILRYKPDLLFLNVELPDIHGGDLLQSMKKEITWDMKVVFCADNEKELLSLFKYQPFDCLLKPFEKKYLQRIIDRFLISASTELPEAFPSDVHHKTLFSVNDIFILPTLTNDLVFLRLINIGAFLFNSEKKQWEIYSNQSFSPITLKKVIKAEYITSCSPSFIQVHQSCIINMHYLIKIVEKKCILSSPFDFLTNLPVSRELLKKIQKDFFSF